MADTEAEDRGATGGKQRMRYRRSSLGTPAVHARFEVPVGDGARLPAYLVRLDRPSPTRRIVVPQISPLFVRLGRAEHAGRPRDLVRDLLLLKEGQAVRAGQLQVERGE